MDFNVPSHRQVIDEGNMQQKRESWGRENN